MELWDVCNQHREGRVPGAGLADHQDPGHSVTAISTLAFAFSAQGPCRVLVCYMMHFSPLRSGKGLLADGGRGRTGEAFLPLVLQVGFNVGLISTPLH